MTGAASRAPFGLRITATAPLTYYVPGPCQALHLLILLLISKEINSGQITFLKGGGCAQEYLLTPWGSGGSWPQEGPRVRDSGASSIVQQLFGSPCASPPSSSSAGKLFLILSRHSREERPPTIPNVPHASSNHREKLKLDLLGLLRERGSSAQISVHWVPTATVREGDGTGRNMTAVALCCHPEEDTALRRCVDLNPVLFGSKSQELALEGEGRGRGTVHHVQGTWEQGHNTEFHMKIKF